MRLGREPETTAKLIVEMDAILFHIGGIDRILDEAPDLAPEERRVLRQTADQLFKRVDRLLTWLCKKQLARTPEELTN